MAQEFPNHPGNCYIAEYQEIIPKSGYKKLVCPNIFNPYALFLLPLTWVCYQLLHLLLRWEVLIYQSEHNPQTTRKLQSYYHLIVLILVEFYD